MMPSFWSADKLVHIVCFAALAFAWTLWFSTDNWRKHPLRNLIVCILIVSVYGIVDEFHQSFVPSREASATDWLADTLGAVAGSMLGRYVMCKFAPLSKIL
jgi:VanZ family protein